MFSRIRTDERQNISFDVFDTLIKRSVARPSDLFLLMENHLSNSRPEIPAGFAQKRMKAEKDAYEDSQHPANLEEIYNKLRQEYGEDTDELMNLEIQMELRGCQPNPQYVKWFHQCTASGKTVVLISDMYLPSQVISQMLNKCGICGYKKLFVSCECGACKGDGSLFRLALKELCIRPNELLHIGDNPRGDFLVPRLMGVKTILVCNDQKHICKSPKSIQKEAELAYRTMRACIRNGKQDMAVYEKMGCEFFGPQLYGFSQWLADRLCQDEISDVYFLARDGYMLKRAFDELHIEGIKTNYMYCSRRAFQVPLFWLDSDLEMVKDMFSFRRTMTFRRFFLQLGLDPDVYQSKIERWGIDLDRIYDFNEFIRIVERVYETIRVDVVQNAKEEYAALMEYLRSLDFQKKIAVVDIGFRGTIQYCLERLLKSESSEIQIKGYYLNASKKYIEKYGIKAEGYVYREQPYDLLFEAQFLAQDGSLKRFKLEEGKSVPILEAPEYTANGQGLLNEEPIIREYQTGAIRFIQYMREVMPLDAIKVNSDSAMCNIERLLTMPSLKEARLWGDFRFLNFTRGYLAHPQSWLTYLLHPGRLKEDLLSSGWRIGFMRRLCLLPLPYQSVLSVIKKLL